MSRKLAFPFVLKLIASFILLLIFGLQAYSQSKTKLSGKIINSRNEPVPGATVILEGTSLKTAADVEGRFSFLLEIGKKYSLKVSSAGYSSKAVDEVEVKEGNDNNTLTVVLETKSELGEVVVRSSVRKETTSALINLQRNNTAVSSGIAADLIRRTPDRTTGEVLKRVSGASIQDNKFVIIRGLSDRYNAAFINNAQLPSSEPDRKAFSFDVIPANMIDNIIINKTATPGLTGEFAGGLIQVQTKDIPSKNFLSVGFQFGYNTASTFKDFVSNPRSGTDWIGWDDGTRRLPKGFPATRQEYNNLSLDGQLEKSRLFKDDVFKQTKSTALPVMTYNLSYGSAKTFNNGGKLGFIASAIYRKAMLKSEVERQLSESDGRVSFNYTDYQNKYQTNLGALVNLTYTTKKHKVSLKNIFNRYFEDNYYTRNGFNVDRNQDISFYSSFLNQRTFYSGQLEGDHQLNWKRMKFRWNAGYAYVSRNQPDLRTQQYTKASGSDITILDNDDSRRFWSDLKDHTVTASGTFSLPFDMFGNKQMFKLGGSTLVRFRDFSARTLRYSEASTTFDTELSSLPYDQIFKHENFSPNGFVFEEITNNQDKYFGISTINSGFLMLDNRISEKLRLIWGARLEYFEQFLTTKDLSAKRVNINTENLDVLPSVNLTYSINSSSNIRFASYLTVARPEFREIAPFGFFDYEANYNISGNPDLKQTKIFNIDLRYELYPAAGEAISFGGFYKNFTNPIEFRLGSASSGTRRQYEFNNASDASTFGLEFELRKNLGFLSKDSRFWENVVAFGNLTYLFSKVNFADASSSGQSLTSNRPIQGQSPYLVNFGLQYSSTKLFNATLLYNRIGPRLALVGNLDFPDIYERPRNLLDFQLSKRILANKGELKLSFSDILNNDIYLYEDVVGNKEFNSGDRLFSRYKPGSTISIGFTYDFDFKK